VIDDLCPLVEQIANVKSPSRNLFQKELVLKRIDFYFEDRAVGYFQRESELTLGEHPYMPYRGLGHQHLVEVLSSGPQRCYSLKNGEKQFFCVRRIVSLHLLEIA
jgi:hypothetical protein